MTTQLDVQRDNTLVFDSVVISDDHDRKNEVTNPPAIKKGHQFKVSIPTAPSQLGQSQLVFFPTSAWPA
jgi:hypothetical protein